MRGRLRAGRVPHGWVGRTPVLLFTTTKHRKKLSLSPDWGWGTLGNRPPIEYQGATKNGAEEDLMP